MIPPDAYGGTGSEIETFEAIRDELGSEWTAIHSLGLTSHPDKPWTEIDFVLVGPGGVFCLEVKGGQQIDRQGGLWHYTDGRGRVVTRKESPFEQAGSAAAALRNHVVDRSPGLRAVPFGYGVVTPWVDFTVQGPEIEPAVVYDASDNLRPFGVYVERLTKYWHRRLRKGSRSVLQTSSEDQIAEILQLLTLDFQLRPSLRSRVGRIERELIRLTTEQMRILHDIENERALIRGGAGSGKTLLAIDSAVEAARSGHKVFLTCFSRRLGDWLASETRDVPNLSVSAFHSFMARTVTDAGMDDLLPPASEDYLFEAFYPQVCMEALLELQLTGTYDLVIVDEAQDLLLPDYLDVFDQLLNGGLKGGLWKFFLDPNQDLFTAINPVGMKRILEAEPARHRLSINCRNTRQIAADTSILSGVGLDQVLRTDGPEVDHLWWRDNLDQVRLVSRFINRLLSQGIQPGSITVIGPNRLANSGFSDGLTDSPFPLKERGGAGTIEYTSTASFKGLETEVAILVDVEDVTNADIRHRLYVGASRARVILAVAISEGAKDQYLAAAGEFGGTLVANSSEW